MRRRSLLSLLSCGIAMIALGGCAEPVADEPGLTKRKFDAITRDTSSSQLIELLGQPTETRGLGPALERTWVWSDGEKRVEVVINPGGGVMSNGNRPLKYASGLE